VLNFVPELTYSYKMKRGILFVATLFCFAFTARAQAPGKELATAILKNNAAAAETLLTAGANPNAAIEVVPGFPTTYLITAAANGSLDLVKLLLKHKAQVNQLDGFKATALMAAAGKGHQALVELLLASGADVKAKDDDGKDALALAKESGSKEVVALLEQKLK
jgi:ankyrin repeat protein